MMPRILFIASFILATQISIGQRENSAIFIPEDMRAGSVAVVRNSEVSFRVISENDAVRAVSETISILNAKGDAFGNFMVINGRYIDLGSFKGVIYDQLGNVIKKINKSDLHDESYNSGSLFVEDRLLYFEPNLPKYPYTVHYEYELKYNSLLFFPKWQAQPSFDVSVEKSGFNVVVPDGYIFRYNESNIDPPEVTSGSKSNIIFAWSVKNLPAIKKEPFCPYFSELTPTVETAPYSFMISGSSGRMETWEGFGRWIQSLNEGKRELPQNTISEIRAATRNIRDTLELVKIMYEYLQNKTRYVSIQLGIGGWQPVEAAIVDKNGYGDCKALSNYMISLLEIFGIKSRYALVRAGNDVSDIKVGFPGLQFNHVIVCVPLTTDTIWLECTNQNMPFGYLGRFTSDRHVLAVSDTGSEIMMTPAYPAGINTQIRTAKVHIDAEGDAMANIKTIYSGLQYDHVKDIIRESYAEQKKWIYADKEISTFDVLDFSFKEYTSEYPAIIETLDLRINNYISFSGNRCFLPLNLMNKMDRLPRDSEDRIQDIVLKYPFWDTDTVFYYKPSNFYAEYLPEAILINSEFGTYSSKVIVNQDTITYVRHLDIHKGRFPPEKYHDLMDFYNSIVKADKAKIVLIDE